MDVFLVDFIFSSFVSLILIILLISIIASFSLSTSMVVSPPPKLCLKLLAHLKKPGIHVLVFYNHRFFQISDLNCMFQFMKSKVFHLMTTHCCGWWVQMIFLDEWTILDHDYCSSLSGATEALMASMVRLPVVCGARVSFFFCVLTISFKVWHFSCQWVLKETSCLSFYLYRLMSQNCRMRFVQQLIYCRQ